MVCREEPDVGLSTHAHLNHGFFELAKGLHANRLPGTRNLLWRTTLEL